MLKDRVSNGIMRAYYRYRAPGAIQAFQELSQSQWFPAERLREIQRRRLLDLLQSALRHVPYYRDLLAGLRAAAEDFRSEADLRRLPVLSKEILREQGSRLLDERVDVASLLRNSTGGSTGTPVNFYQSRAYWRMGFAAMWRAWLLFPGLDLGARRFRFWGADRDEPHRALRVVGRLLFNEIFLNSFGATTRDLDWALDRIETSSIKLLIAYVSSAELLARRAREAGRRIRIPSIVTSAEALSGEQRGLLQETFGARVYNAYGCREVGAIAQECGAADGLHVNTETQWVELEPLDPARPDGPCRILVTHLHNSVMPLLRYDLGDSVAKSDLRWDRCACGRSLPRMDTVTGRVSDIILSPHGGMVHGEYFTHLFYNQEAVKAFQIHQLDRKRLMIRIVPGGEYSDSFVRRVEQWIRRDHGFSEVVVELCDAIQPDPSGKLRFTRSDVDPRRGSSERRLNQ